MSYLIDMLDENKLRAALDSEPKRSDVTYAYGTAGFRMPNDSGQLRCALLRAAMLACVRSQVLGGQAVGIMITASHNREPDNGAKLCDGDGGMLAADWEPLAVKLANAVDSASALAILAAIEVPAEHRNVQPHVLVARDTRATSGELRDVVLVALLACGAVADDRGILTTPQLHHMVRALNSGADDSEEAYYALLAGAFERLRPAAAAASHMSVGEEFFLVSSLLCPNRSMDLTSC